MFYYWPYKHIELSSSRYVKGLYEFKLQNFDFYKNHILHP